MTGSILRLVLAPPDSGTSLWGETPTDSGQNLTDMIASTSNPIRQSLTPAECN
ncbi:MAG: hypothetical protein JWR17_696 [Pseudomonas sp.]|jgi:hypothetical protein|nr:hypothetical protein [Pseudomonas sp.]